MGNKFNAFVRFLCMPVLLFVFGSCDVHQFPEKEEALPIVKVKVPIKLVYQHDFYVWEHNYDPVSSKIQEIYPDLNLFPSHPGTSSKYANILSSGVLDVYVKVFDVLNPDKAIAEQTFTTPLNGDIYDDILELELPGSTSYRVAVWSHLREDSEKQAYYDPSNFYHISIVSGSYAGNTDYRDGFSGCILLTTSDADETTPHEVEMTRPMGKFELLTIDLSEFLDRETTRRRLGSRARAEEYNVLISFPYYYPSSYSLFDDRLENSVSGVSFRTKLNVTGESEASLGFEYVLLNNNTDAGVQVQVDVYDPSYTHVAGSSILTIPMCRDRHTVLKGAFLSSEGEGGIGIDPSFEGDHNITI